MKKILAIILTAIMIMPTCFFVGCDGIINQGKGYEAILSYKYGTLYFCDGVKTLSIRLRCTSAEYPHCEERFNILRVRKYNRFKKVNYNYLPNDAHHNEDDWISVFPYAYYGKVYTEEFPDGITKLLYPNGDDEAPEYYMEMYVDGMGTDMMAGYMGTWGYKLQREGFYKLTYNLYDKTRLLLDTFTLYVELYPLGEGLDPTWDFD